MPPTIALLPSIKSTAISHRSIQDRLRFLVFCARAVPSPHNHATCQLYGTADAAEARLWQLDLGKTQTGASRHIDDQAVGKRRSGLGCWLWAKTPTRKQVRPAPAFFFSFFFFLLPSPPATALCTGRPHCCATLNAHMTGAASGCLDGGGLAVSLNRTKLFFVAFTGRYW